MNSPWRELGLPGPSDTETIKRAYAQRIKEVHPEEDPEGFQALHRAYQMARRMATDRQPRRPSFQSPEVRPEPQETPAESEDLDFSALEDAEEEPPEEAESEDLDFSALEDTEEEEKEQTEDWDFEELLEEDEPEDRPPPEDLPHQAEEYETVWGRHRRKRRLDKWCWCLRY